MSNFYKNTEIVIVKDFLSESEAEYLLLTAGPANNTSWNTSGENAPETDNYTFWDNKNLFLHKLEDFNKDIISDIEARMRKEHERAYGLASVGASYTQINIIHRFSAGDGMEPHADRGPHETNNNISHGFIVYLNDDYEGGEIYYPKLGHSIKPTARSLVMHPGTVEYTHGVSPVLSGNRYSLTMFAREHL